MIFSFFPPEFNSTMMYTGPGSGPLATAATAWEGLANDLQSAATSFQTIVSELTSGSWTGPSSQQMLAAVEPFVGWLNTTSAQAAQTAAQATQAVSSFEVAHAMTIPPAAVFANRAELLLLIATNFFGQNTPAIAANEAQYAAYWVTDATAMNTYSAVSTQTAALPQLTTPAPAASTNGAPQSVTSAASSTDAVLNALNGLLNQLNSGLGSVSGFQPLPTLGSWSDVGSWLGTLGTTIGTDASALGTVLGLGASTGTTGLSSSSALLPLQAAYYGAMMASMPARMFMGMGNSLGAAGAARTATGAMMGTEGLMNNIGQFVDGKMQAVIGSVSGQLRSWAGSVSSAVSAQLGRATAMGGLSVPHAWTEAATGTVTRAAPILPNTSVSAPALTPQAGTMPGGPFGNALMGALSGRGLASMAAKAPKVVPKSPAAG